MVAKHGPTREEFHKQAKGIASVYINLKLESDAGSLYVTLLECSSALLKCAAIQELELWNEFLFK
jgi:hypothetical protein